MSISAAGPRSFSRRLVCVTFAVAAMGTLGCENPQRLANQQARAKAAEAEKAAESDNLSAAQAGYGAAASVSGISWDEASRNYNRQGQIKLDQAEQSLRQAESKELDIGRLLAQVRIATTQIKTLQQQINADMGFDPKPLDAQLQARIDEAQGKGGKVAWPAPGGKDAGADVKPTDGGAMLSLDAIKAEVARLQAAIDDNRAKQKDLSAQQATATAQGDALQLKSTSEKGQQSVDDFVAGADAHKKAADLGVEIEKLDAAVLPLQSDVAALKDRQAAVEKAIAGYQKQIADLDANWKIAQEGIDQQKKQILVIAGSGSAPSAPESKKELKGPEPIPLPPLSSPTIGESAAQLKGLLTDSRKLRDNAAADLKEAIKAFHAEAAADDKLSVELGKTMQAEHVTPKEKVAYQQILETHNSSAARLLEAGAERALALDQATEAITARNVTASLQAAAAALGADAPTSIQDALAAVATPTADTLAQQAEAGFNDAMTHFDNQIKVQTSTGPGAEERRIQAEAGKMVTAYDIKQLSEALGDKPMMNGLKPSDFQGMIDSLGKSIQDSKDPTLLPSVPVTFALVDLPAPSQGSGAAPTDVGGPSKLFNPASGTGAAPTTVPSTDTPPAQ